MAEDIQKIESINPELPKPIAFNCWKHHLGYVQGILNNQPNFNKDDSFIREILQFIGTSQFDYYIGTLDIFKISNEVMAYLKSENITNFEEYKRWLISSDNDYRCISISDESNWTLRLGHSSNRYIHIHPSRHSKKTVRIKSSSLKTAYAFLFYYRSSDMEITIEKINSIRNKLAKLPTLKPTSPSSAVRRIIDLFVS